jgi:hypothetical protein
MGSPHTWQPFISRQQHWMNPIAHEEKGSRHNLQPDWVVRRSATEFLFQHSHWSNNESQTSFDSRLLGLPDAYHRHAIGTFNTYSRWLTHRSLTDTGGGYNLAGVGLPTPLPDLPNQRSYTFHLMVLLGLRLSIQTLPTEIKKEQTLYLTSGTSTLDFYGSLSSKYSMS